MGNDNGSFEFGYSKLKSARQKKRLQKEDSEKQLRALHQREQELSLQKRNLPFVPLEIPYQKGWVRSFRLHDDVARSSKASFFQALLEKIDTKQYSKTKTFRRKRGRKASRKYEYVAKEPLLQYFSEEEWKSPKLLLTESEQQFFAPKECWNERTGRIVIRYIFIDPWRYVLQTKPHIITHVRLVDEVLEQQMKELDNKIDFNYLRPKMNRIIHGKSYRRRYFKREKEKDTLKNIPLHQIVYEANNDII